MARIPDDFVETLQQRIDIVDVVGDYVQLRRSGRSFVGLCPFHNERTPSFSVSPDRQMFYCFGCGAGGSVIRFVMDIEGLTFVESVIRLAERANLALPVQLEDVSVQTSQSERIERMRQAHELATKFYSYILMNSSVGVQALTYLEGRGIEKQTMTDFRLGYAPKRDRRLVEFLDKRGFDSDLLVECGLAVKVGDRIMDRFRHRLMVPICDGRGQVIAFGGRSLEPNQQPKYLNSPESPLFQKSRVLFHLHEARKFVRKTGKAVLFEGYMDVISAWQAGVQSGVASMGTSLTEEHLDILRRYTDHLVVAYDGDSAGQRATRRVLEMAAQSNMRCQVVQFPDGLDPDDFVRQRGAAAFVRQFEAKTLTEVQYLVGTLRQEMLVESPAGRTEYIRRVLGVLADRATPIERDTELHKLADEFRISVDALQQEMRMLRKNSTKQKRRGKETAHRDDSPVLSADIRAGNLILQSLLTNGEAMEILEEEGLMELPLPEQTALLARLIAFRTQNPGGSTAAFLNSLEETELLRYAAELSMKEGANVDAPIIRDCLRTLGLRQTEQAYQQALQALVDAQVSGQLAAVEELRVQVQDLQRQIAQRRAPRSE